MGQQYEAALIDRKFGRYLPNLVLGTVALGIGLSLMATSIGIYVNNKGGLK